MRCYLAARKTPAMSEFRAKTGKSGTSTRRGWVAVALLAAPLAVAFVALPLFNLNIRLTETWWVSARYLSAATEDFWQPPLPLGFSRTLRRTSIGLTYEAYALRVGGLVYEVDDWTR